MLDVRQMSYPNYDLAVEELIWRIAPKTFLDIGTGLGKYGKMAQAIRPTAYRTGIEACSDLAREAAPHYDVLWPVDASFLMDHHVEKRWDLTVIGDCLEHMTKSQGTDLLDFLIYRSKWIVVLYPLGYIQDVVEGNPHELHQSIWSPTDFDNYTYFWARTNIVDEEQGGRSIGYCLVILRGYLAEMRLKDLVKKLPLPWPDGIEKRMHAGIWERGL